MLTRQKKKALAPRGRQKVIARPRMPLHWSRDQTDSFVLMQEKQAPLIFKAYLW